MKWPRVRFTVRRNLILVAVVAIAACGWRLWDLRRHYLRTARLHEAVAYLLREGHADIRRDLRRSAHHEALRIKYERAARSPWLSVEPDPPEPK